jgi:hypothetical protein
MNMEFWSCLFSTKKKIDCSKKGFCDYFVLVATEAAICSCHACAYMHDKHEKWQLIQLNRNEI